LIIILCFRWVNPPTTAVMISERENIKGNKFHNWLTLENLGNNISLAVVASEDSNFCDHSGFDFSEILKVRQKGAVRGASTISQQVSKNLFLWRARSWTRKGIEAVITVFIEALWPKKRILEVYLNIAETGEGYFGVSSIAQKRFGKEPKKLSLKQAAYIAVTLPNPKKRNARRLTQKLKTQAQKVQIGATTLKMEGRASCFMTK
jgi:monofunctional biosynthetic peptidoglycan transglycosylase